MTRRDLFSLLAGSVLASAFGAKPTQAPKLNAWERKRILVNTALRSGPYYVPFVDTELGSLTNELEFTYPDPSAYGDVREIVAKTERLYRQWHSEETSSGQYSAWRYAPDGRLVPCEYGEKVAVWISKSDPTRGLLAI